MNAINTKGLHRDTWVEIYLDRIESNVKKLREFLPKHTRFMAAVKANAYNHGAVEVSRVVLDAGADSLAVSILKEALILREAGIEAPILVLTPILPSDVNIAIEHNISVTVFQESWLRQMKKYKRDPRPLSIHIKIDTGLSRIGLRSIEELEKVVALLGPEVKLEGMYTHFATANFDDPQFFYSQFHRFQAFMNWAKEKKLDIQYFHCSNTAAALKYPESQLDLVRIGVGIFGIYPSQEIKRNFPFQLEPTISFHSKVLYVKKVKKGTPVGYGDAYIAPQDEWIATIPVGYADGWFRCFQGFHVLVEGKPAPIVGAICMDQLMVRLPRKVALGTQVTLLGRQGDAEITLEQLAEHIGSVPQEIPSMITERVPRVYLHGERPVEIVLGKGFEMGS